jgi:hypothetical protein
MKVKSATSQEISVGFTVRELVLINNCLNEACHGLLMDRFVPAHDDLVDMLNCVFAIVQKDKTLETRPVPV